MEITYKLFIGQFHVLKEAYDLNDIVYGIEYTYSGFAEIDGIGYSHGITKAAPIINKIEDINKDGFIDFKDITKEQAEEWVMASISDIDLQYMKMTIEKSIENQSKLTVMRAPWVEIAQPVDGLDIPIEKE